MGTRHWGENGRTNKRRYFQYAVPVQYLRRYAGPEADFWGMRFLAELWVSRPPMVVINHRGGTRIIGRPYLGTSWSRYKV